MPCYRINNGFLCTHAVTRVYICFEARPGKAGFLKTKGEGIMGHFIFVILHFMVVLFGVVGLVITVPLHIIYSAVKK